MKTFTITLAWGQPDEGLYHWAGQAEDEDQAIKMARAEMDATYEDAEPEEYRVVDIYEGVNEFAAMDMLAALRLAVPQLAAFADLVEGKGGDNTELYAALEAVDAAIARGEGRI